MVVVLCVSVSVTKLAATYLVCESKVRFYKVPYGIPNALLASFANAKLLDFSPSDSSMTLRINGMLRTHTMLYMVLPSVHARGVW